MRRLKKLGVLVFAIAFMTVFCMPQTSRADYGYTIRIYTGNQGTIANGDNGDNTVRTFHVNYNDEFTLDTSWISVNNSSKYYVRGFKISGEDALYGRANFTVTRDYDFIVGYGMRGNEIPYTISFVEYGTGRQLADPITYYGNLNDKPVVAYQYIENYRPLYRNITGTLKESGNNWTFEYASTAPVNTGGNTGGTTGGDNTSGGTTGGNTSGGNTGGDNTSGGTTGGGNASGGDNTSGGNAGGGNTTGGTTGGGNTGGGNTSGGNAAGGNATGGTSGGGNTGGGNTSGGNTTGGGATGGTSGSGNTSGGNTGGDNTSGGTTGGGATGGTSGSGNTTGGTSGGDNTSGGTGASGSYTPTPGADPDTTEEILDLDVPLAGPTAESSDESVDNSAAGSETDSTSAETESISEAEKESTQAKGIPRSMTAVIIIICAAVIVLLLWLIFRKRGKG